MGKIQPELKNIPIYMIKPNPYQPRKKFDKKSLEELSQSIKSYGVIQPISVREMKSNSYELIAGERRLRATELAGLDTIPAIVMDYNDRDSAFLALIENLQRDDLNFIEEAEGYQNLLIDHDFTQQDIANKIGKSQSTIANKLRLLKLPDDLRRALLDNNLTERHGRALLKLSDDDLKREVMVRVIKRELNVSKTEALVKSILDDLTSEREEQSLQSIKSMINVKIYLNTLKNAYKAIKETGVDAEYKEVDKGAYVEVMVKIPKQ